VLAALLSAGYAALGRDAARALLGLSPRPQSAPAPAAQAPRVAGPRVGELRVDSTPEPAQVLMFVGRGPASVSKLPVGVAQEFVALAPGFAPSRAVVPEDAQWQQEGGELRYELALQLAEARARHAEQDLGATRLGSDVGSAKGPLGTVRIITSPPGAKVYQLIGFTPDVRVQNMPIATPIELLVYWPGTAPVELSAAEADFKPGEGGLVAQLHATQPSAHRAR
jgi:hypothetical protein